MSMHAKHLLAATLLWGVVAYCTLLSINAACGRAVAVTPPVPKERLLAPPPANKHWEDMTTGERSAVILERTRALNAAMDQLLRKTDPAMAPPSPPVAPTPPR